MGLNAVMECWDRMFHAEVFVRIVTIMEGCCDGTSVVVIDHSVL